MPVARIATCQLNQWALDFENNKSRILKSITISKSAGAKFLTGPELSLCGYGCEDHFFENETFILCWKLIKDILNDTKSHGILLDIGMPVVFESVLYNCRVFCLNGKILLIRPNTCLSRLGTRMDYRYFDAWNSHDTTLYEMQIPIGLNQTTAPFGLGVIRCSDGICVCSEVVSEKNVTEKAGSMLADGVHIIANGLITPYEMGKWESKLSLIKKLTSQGGVYISSNQTGCDMGRSYFEGGSLIAHKGFIEAACSRFSLEDVSVAVANVNIETALSAEGSQKVFPRIDANWCFQPNDATDIEALNCVNKATLSNICVEKEMSLGLGLWLWEYLKRSKARGFFLPLSGGSDSAAVTAIVVGMCNEVWRQANECENIMMDIEKVIRTKRTDNHFPKSSRELTNVILHSCYMGSAHSSEATKCRAKRLAEEANVYHTTLLIDTIIVAILALFASLFGGRKPKFSIHGGTRTEDTALQNIQARVRMVLAYFFASLLPWIRQADGFLLVLGTGNNDECLSGYVTKYDCSAADLNPIGSLSKVDLRRFLFWAASNEGFGLKSLLDIATAPPSAELRPGVEAQTDEEDIGLTYTQLREFGMLRMINRLGPISMFLFLVKKSGVAVTEAAIRVKRFFERYTINRHKMSVMTPALHADICDCEGTRADQRPILYPELKTQYEWIDQLCSDMNISETEWVL